MATVWIYPPEILPLKTRAKGASLAAAADFLGNFLVVEITPPALKNIGYKTYIIFAVLNIVNVIIVWCFYPETAGQTLESVDQIFVADWEDEVAAGGKIPILHQTQWSVVRKARAIAREGTIRRRNAVYSDTVLGGQDKDGDVSDRQVESLESGSRSPKS
jgi:hypothetical protein